MRCPASARRRPRPGRGPDRGPRPARRRRRLPRQRRPRDHRHARLLPAARRRPADLRGDRGGQRPVRRLRDGRPRAVRAVDRGLPRGAAAGRAGGDLRRARRRRSARPAGRWPAATRSATRSPSTGWRSSARPIPDRLLRKGGARPGRRADPDQARSARACSSRRRVRAGRGRADLAAAIDQMRTLNRAASEVLVGRGHRGRDGRHGFGLLGHGLEMARASGMRFVVRGVGPAGAARRARRSPRPASRPAGPPTTGGSCCRR